ncbi:hypothetical protein BH23CHL7_BH23CHL7_06930 [soil metagenome]
MRARQGLVPSIALLGGRIVGLPVGAPAASAGSPDTTAASAGSPDLVVSQVYGGDGHAGATYGYGSANFR